MILVMIVRIERGGLSGTWMKPGGFESPLLGLVHDPYCLRSRLQAWCYVGDALMGCLLLTFVVDSYR